MTYYTRFLDLWKHAQSDLQPWLIDARQRLNARQRREGEQKPAQTLVSSALSLGIAAAASSSAVVIRIVEAVAPLGVLWVNAIRMTVIPLIVASLIVATAGTEAGAVGRLGTRRTARYAAGTGSRRVPGCFRCHARAVGWILAVAPIGIFALALPLAARLGTGVVVAIGRANGLMSFTCRDFRAAACSSSRHSLPLMACRRRASAF